MHRGSRFWFCHQMHSFFLLRSKALVSFLKHVKSLETHTLSLTPCNDICTIKIMPRRPLKGPMSCFEVYLLIMYCQMSPLRHKDWVSSLNNFYDPKTHTYIFPSHFHMYPFSKVKDPLKLSFIYVQQCHSWPKMPRSLLQRKVYVFYVNHVEAHQTYPQ